MAYSSLTRSLRDGQLTLRDGTSPTPIESVITTSEGDLTWTETTNTVKVSNRGTLHHTRPGNQENVTLSFSAKWTQLIQGIVAESDGYTFYEMINALDSIFQSTSGCGEQFTLEMEFLVSSPCVDTPAVGEIITFAKVFKTSIECAEGDEYNLITFNGEDFEQRPVIARNS